MTKIERCQLHLFPSMSSLLLLEWYYDIVSVLLLECGRVGKSWSDKSLVLTEKVDVLCILCNFDRTTICNILWGEHVSLFNILLMSIQKHSSRVHSFSTQVTFIIVFNYCSFNILVTWFFLLQNKSTFSGTHYMAFTHLSKQINL